MKYLGFSNDHWQFICYSWGHHCWCSYWNLMCYIFSVFLSQKLYSIIKPAVELLAGIPSIVYGFFGLIVIVPLFQDMFGGNGKGVLTASVLLGIMILPTIISVSESSLQAIPDSYYEGALALGASHERSVFLFVLRLQHQVSWLV